MGIVFAPQGGCDALAAFLSAEIGELKFGAPVEQLGICPRFMRDPSDFPSSQQDLGHKKLPLWSTVRTQRGTTSPVVHSFVPLRV